MTKDQLLPLDGDIAELLQAESDAPGMPDGADASLRNRLASLLGPALGPVGGGGGDGGGAAGDAGPAPASTMTGSGGATAGAAATASATAGAAGTTAGVTSALTGGTIATIIATTFALGMGAGAGAYSLIVEPEVIERRVEVPVVVAGPERATPEEPAQEELLPMVDAGAVDARAIESDARSPRRSKRPHRDDTLEAERVLIERSRAALARRSPNTALAALREHAQRFPTGRLAEEREAMLIQTLVSTGRYNTAMQRAEIFRRRYPSSLFRQVIDSAVSSISVTDSGPSSQTQDGRDSARNPNLTNGTDDTSNE